MISFTPREITGEDIPAVQLFLIQHLNEFFAADRPAPTPGQDVFNLQQQYIQQQRNVLLCAWSEKQELIATLAVCQYDDRIAELRGRYILTETAEICRCYVDKRYRRKGIGRQLLAFAETFCEQQRYNLLYLHTHHFLPGGYSFWRRNHFQVVMDMHDDWQLVHMERSRKSRMNKNIT